MKFLFISITNMYFQEAIIGLSKENKVKYFWKLKIKKNIREVSKKEKIQVTAGKWIGSYLLSAFYREKKYVVKRIN